MRQKILRLLAIGTSVAFMSSAAMGQVVNTLNWLQPHALGDATDEIAGPRSIVTVTLPPGLVGAAGLVNGDDLIGVVRSLGAAGNVLDTRSIDPGAFVGGPIAYNNGAGNTIQINFGAITGITASFSAPGVVAIQIALTTDGLMVGANAVQTLFNAADEALDECGRPDNTQPTLTGAFVQGTNLFLVFSETMNNGQAANDDNHTDLGVLNNTSFQVNTANTFAAATAAPNGANFMVTGFADGQNRVVQVDITGSTDVAAGRFIRLASDDNGVPLPGNDVKDIAGNLATPGGSVPTPVTTGVLITAPPPFTVQGVEWVNTYFGGVADHLRVIFSSPVLFEGDGPFYEGPGTGNLRRGGIDSDIDLGFGVVPDPMNPNAVLVTAFAGANDEVWNDGRDFDGNLYTWNYNIMTGNAPTDIFGQALAAAPASPFTVGDAIAPSQVGIAFGDFDGDGKVDEIIFVYDKPVTTNASAGIFTLRKANATVQPIGMIMPDGTLVNANVVADLLVPTNNDIPITGLAQRDVRIDALTPERLNMGNGQAIRFDPNAINWDNNGATTVGSAMEAIPGTGGAVGGPIGGFITVQSTATFLVTDASGNTLTEPVIAAPESPTLDRAAPIVPFAFYFDAENMVRGIPGVTTNNQFFSQQTGSLGNDRSNDRVAFVASETLAAAVNGNKEDVFRLGAGPNDFFTDDTNVANAFGSFVTQMPDNILTLENSDGLPGLVPGGPVGIGQRSGYTDLDDNELRSPLLNNTNRTAPYVALSADVDGNNNIHLAFLFDTNNDNFANQIRITMTQPIDPATVQATDFTLSLGTITGAEVQGNDIVLNVTDGVIPMSSIINVTYRGATDTTPIASLASAGGTGVAVSRVNDTFQARRIPTPDRATQELAFMDIVGQITTDGTTPCPPGTKIYAMIAAPHVYSVTATHNNVAFTVNAQSHTASINAWNNWLFGIREDIYLGRDTTNFQFYDNDKNLGANTGSVNTYKDVIRLNINAGSLTNLSFTGTGETNADRVTAGRVRFCWDVLRTQNGLVREFYDPTSGVAWGGEPIVSSAVVTGTDGRYKLHVSAPIAAFNGLSRLSSVDRPVILIVEKPDGTRFAVSSVLTSVNGAPIRFRVQNRTQSTGQGVDATPFNINLANVGAETIQSDWNLVGFNRNSGFATSAGARPVRVDGVSESAIVIPTSSSPALPFTTPLNQFVFWDDSNNPTNLGSNNQVRWTRGEDNGRFRNIIIDPNCFPHFVFTMTSAGVQFGSGINNLVGGYAFAFFNTGHVFSELGVFQFGPVLTGNTLFAGTSAATSFPNNATTQGWGLFTSKAAFNPASGMRANGNPKLDFLFVFRNNGVLGGLFGRPSTEVSSLDLLAPAGNDNPNDTKRLDAGQPFFGHWQP